MFIRQFLDVRNHKQIKKAVFIRGNYSMHRLQYKVSPY